MRLIEQWRITPFSLPRANEYLEDLSELRFSESGLLSEVNSFVFVNEACQLLANSVKLFELGYFDCAFYSVRQSIELSLNGLYLFSNPNKMKSWKDLKKGFDLQTIVPELKMSKEEYAEIRELFSDFFEKLKTEKNHMNKYIHKQGYMSLYYYYNDLNVRAAPERITMLTNDYETILHDTITAVALYRLVIDPFPILLLDDDIVRRTPDLIADSFSSIFLEKYIPEEFVNRYKESKIYKGYYEYFKTLPVQNEAVYTLIHCRMFERKDYDQIKKQHELLPLHDMEAVELFMLSSKIGSVILDGYFDYTSETKLKDTSLVLGEAYYSKLFNGQKGHNLAYKGDYISQFPLNDRITYLKHNDLLTTEEINMISAMCEQYTKLFKESSNEGFQTI